MTHGAPHIAHRIAVRGSMLSAWGRRLSAEGRPRSARCGRAEERRFDQPMRGETSEAERVVAMVFDRFQFRR